MTPEPVHFAEEDQETWLKTPKKFELKSIFINILFPKVSVGFGLPMWFVDNKNVEHHQIFPSKLSGFCEKPTNVWCLKSSTFPLEKESTSSLKQNRRHVNDKKSAKYFKSSRNKKKTRPFSETQTSWKFNLLDGGRLQNKSVKQQKQRIQMLHFRGGALSDVILFPWKEEIICQQKAKKQNFSGRLRLNRWWWEFSVHSAAVHETQQLQRSQL